MSRFAVTGTQIAGLQVFQRQPISDERGYFERLFCVDELKPILSHRSILQINHTLTARVGTVRGMHFQQSPHAEMKMISCLRGEVFDVAVDLRKDSPTFLRWHGEILSEKNHLSLCIPEGFAHGFQTLKENSELVYFHTSAYEPNAEAGLNALDPRVGILWPMPIAERSARDQHYAMLTSSFSGLRV